MNIHDEAAQWVNTKEYAQDIKDRFIANVVGWSSLWEHRQFCANGYGLGEDAFHWMWKLLVDEMPKSFNFLEVGVYMGQIPSLIRMLSQWTGKDADIYGVTMLSSFSGVTGTRPPHPNVNYLQGIQRLHDRFGLQMPELIVGDSTSDEVHAQVESLAPFDMIFVDACHEYDYVLNDLLFYPELIKSGGYLITDDSACDLEQPWGFFQGIWDVTKAVQTVIQTSPQWEHVITVCHDRIWRKQ